MVFDGTTAKQVMTDEVLDYTIENSELYILRTDGMIQKTTNLTTWTDVMTTSPLNFYSIAVLNGKVYIGTKDATIYVLDTSGSFPTPIPPTQTPTLVPGSNILINSSFETNNNGVPANWSSGIWDNTVSRTGIASMRINGPASGNYSWQKPLLKPSTTYTVQGYVKSSNIPTTDQGGSFRYINIPGSIAQTPAVNGTKDWTFVSKVFTTPADWTTSSRLDIFAWFSTGTAWFDDVALCEGSCPVDNSPTNTPAPTSILTPTLAPPTPTAAPSDTILPTVSITSPTDGSTINRKGAVTITANATDNIGIDHVTFTVAGIASTDYTAPYTYKWSVAGKPNATYTITATAYDAFGNSALNAVRVTTSK